MQGHFYGLWTVKIAFLIKIYECNIRERRCLIQTRSGWWLQPAGGRTSLVLFPQFIWHFWQRTKKSPFVSWHQSTVTDHMVSNQGKRVLLVENTSQLDVRSLQPLTHQLVHLFLWMLFKIFAMPRFRLYVLWRLHLTAESLIVKFQRLFWMRHDLAYQNSINISIL